MKQHFFDMLPGYFDFADIYSEQVAKAKYETASVFIETGTLHGRSLAYMAVEILNFGKNIVCHSYDLWNGQRRKSWPHKKVSLPEVFAQNGCDGVAIMHRSDSAEAAKNWADDSVDFVFIDSNHELVFVQRDIRAWWPKVKSGCTFGGHDYYPAGKNPDNIWPDVAVAVHEFFDPLGIAVEHRGNSWLVVKP